MRARLEIENEEVIIYFIYQPSGVLAPVQGNCETYVGTYGSNFFFSSLLWSVFFIFVLIDIFFLWIIRRRR